MSQDQDIDLDDIMNESDDSDESGPKPEAKPTKDDEREDMEESKQIPPPAKDPEKQQFANTPKDATQPQQVLVDPNAVVYPTPKSDGAAVLAMTQNAQISAGNDENPGAGSDDDLNQFSDIESQDDAVTRERKEKKRLSLRKGMTTVAQGLVEKAGSLMQNMTRQQSTPIAGNSSSTYQDQEAATPSKLDDPEKMSEDEQARIMRMIEQEDSSDEDEGSDEGDEDSTGQVQPKEGKEDASDADSFCSDNDILNRSLEVDCGDPILAENYLRYASDKYNSKLDILEIIDKNERSFKQVAEKMIQQSSQLAVPTSQEASAQPKRKLMHTQVFKKIANRFHGDVQVAQGVPYSIAALEDFIAIGSSDGSVRLFDHSEQEITVLTDKKVRGSAVTCLDFKRIGEDKIIYLVSGHMKGQIAIYKIEGLLEQQAFIERQKTENPFLKAQDSLLGNIRDKHCKTLDDLHDTTISCIKFVGDLTEQIHVISGDVKGNVQLTEFRDGTFRFKATPYCLMQKRLGATFSLAPLIYSQNQSRHDANQAYMEVMQRLDGNIYATEKEKEIQMQRLAKAQGSQLVGFGSLEEVYIAQVRPRALPLVSIRRPPYIQPGTVPYLDWGYALTPTFRDQSYPVIAIAWGKTIQLGVYHNQRQVNQDLEEPRIELDGFYICDDESIDQCYFLSESLLFILVNRTEVRILYTQNFTPGCFSANYPSKILRGRKVGGDPQAEEEQAEILDFTRIKTQYAGEVSTYAEKDQGYNLMDEEIRHKDNNTMIEAKEVKSKFNFNATVCKNGDFTIVALGKQTIGQRNLIHWEEYLDMIRKTNPDDWLKVLRAALDIYNGKMVGLAGLPDQQEKREVMLRERMKDLLRENINACIQEFQEGESVSQTTLRVATEFCIRVGAIDHLFGSLFKMFAEAGMEQRYFQNLDAFILSGKFKQTIIPDHILTRLIQFYRQTDVELLEKAILNLNLSKYPDAEHVRHICEEEYLSSALIHLLTTLFDDETSNDAAICISILCSLFNMMMRNQTQKSRDELLKLPEYMESQGTSIFETQTFNQKLSAAQAKNQMDQEEVKKLETYVENRQIKLEIEHSRTYIGYKLLWVMSLFMEGKKFPSGSLSQFKWRCYIYDIVRFLTNLKFLGFFLEFDANGFFDVLKKLFLEQEPYEYIRTQCDFIMKHSEEVIGLEPCMNHEEIIIFMDTQVSAKLKEDRDQNEGELSAKGEALANAFMFFITSISKRAKLFISEELSLRIISEQILFHKKLLKLDKQELKQLIPETQSTRKIKDRTYNTYAYLVKKNELEILGLVQRHQNTMSPETLQRLVDESASAPLFKLRVLLQQLQGNFQKCLTMFFQIRSIKADVFSWLDMVQDSLEKGQTLRATEEQEESKDDSNSDEDQPDNNADDFGFFEQKGVPYRITIQKMKELIFTHIASFVQMDPEQTVKLCDQWFDSDYNSIAKELKDQKDLAYNFLHTVLLKNEQIIINECENSGTMTGYKPSQKYIDLLLHFVDILCSKKYRSKIVEFVSRSYFPIDESLKICEEKGALEASAVLYKRNQDYIKAIELYTKVLVDLGTDIVHTLFDVTFQDMDRSNEHIVKFDDILGQVIKICDKQSSRVAKQEQEELWKKALTNIFAIKKQVFELISNDMDSDSDEGAEEKENFRRFLNSRNQMLIRRMSEYINLHRIVSWLEEQGHYMEYMEFKQTFKDKVQQESYTEEILLTAKKLLTRDMQQESTVLGGYLMCGVVNKGNRCDHCQLKFNFKWDKQEVWLFKCDHIFHTTCIQATQGQCAVCFNELEAFQSIVSTKKQSMAAKRAHRRTMSKSLTATMLQQTASDATSSSSSTTAEQDELEKQKQERQDSLKQSKEFIENQGAQFVSKEERQLRLMNVFENLPNPDKLELSSFNF